MQQRTKALWIAPLLVAALSITACDEEDLGRDDDDMAEDYIDGEIAEDGDRGFGDWDDQAQFEWGLPEGCWVGLYTGVLPSGQQRSYSEASHHCGHIRLRVGYVDLNGYQRSTSSTYVNPNKLWLNEVLIDSPSWQHVNYVRACLLDHGGYCRAIYR